MTPCPHRAPEDLVRALDTPIEDIVPTITVDRIVEPRADRVLDRREAVGINTVVIGRPS